MKKIVTVIICTLFHSISIAQTFPAPGAYWHYQLCNNFFPYVCGPSIIAPQGPAVIAGVACTEVQLAPSSCVGTNLQYVYESNDTVYHYLPSQTRFTMLYDFNAQTGDTWNIISNAPGGFIDSVLLQVDSTAFVQINSVTRKIIYTSYATSFHYFDFNGPMVEGIGSLAYFFPQFGMCDPQVDGLRCYDDSLVGHYQPNVAIACDSVVPVGIYSVDDEIKFSVYPNPFNESLTLTLSKGEGITECEIKVTDMLGREIYSKKTKPLSVKVTLSFGEGWGEAGIYFLEIHSGNKRAVKKIIRL